MRFRNLGRYRVGGTTRNMQLSVPLPRTPDGRIYRYSPNERAHPRHFVLGDAERPGEIDRDQRARMQLEPGSNQTVCPYSGVIAADEDFAHPDDREAAVEIVKHAALVDMEEALAGMFEGLSRGQSQNSPIRIEAKVTKSSRPKPRFYRSDLLRELVCDHCGRDYGIYAIGLFCPDCGAPNLRLHFAREVELVGAQIDLAEGLGTEKEELAYRLLGNAHEDVLTAFEATLKTVYLFGWNGAHPGEAPPRVGNDFQNVERGQRRYAEFSVDPFAALDDEELAAMQLNIQKRHVIGHNLGVVDAKFAEHSEEAALGETVQLVGEDIRRFAVLAQKVVDALDGWLAGQAVPPRERSEAKEAEEEEGGVRSHADELGLTELAFRIGSWLTEGSNNGLSLPIDNQALASAFEGVPERELTDAVAELSSDGYVEATGVFGSALPLLRYRLDLFTSFDPLVRGTDPTLDAVILARMVLEEEERGIGVEQLHARSEWDRRRFNPALSVMLGEIDEKRVSRTANAEYPTQHFFLLPEDRVSLRRFVDRHAKAAGART